MRVGVTGASGLIGSALTRALTERGDEVVRFVRPDSARVEGLTLRWDPRRGSFDEGDLDRIGGFDAVVHLAGQGVADKRWTAEQRYEVLNSRIASTSLVVEILRASKHAAAVLASGSAIGYYGSRGDELLDEHSSAGEGFLADVCMHWEAAALEASQLGSAVATLRTGIVMSAVGGALARQLPLFRLGLGGRLGTGRQWLSPISLDDEVRAILWVIDHRLSGPFNLVAPEPVTNAVFTAAMGHALHRPSVTRVPAFALRAILGSQLANQAILASQRVVPRALSDSGFDFVHPDISSILRAVLSRA
ncbi:MAG TPA: TIGR01777 family oxidoreductase [Acidimicrobiales bacterium]|nr:TIGR01777 family oxidoreductase [Acidimicrobiales bacterium]